MKKTIKNFAELEKVTDFVVEMEENEKIKKFNELYYSVDENTPFDELQAIYKKMLPILTELEKIYKSEKTFENKAENEQKKVEDKTFVKSFKWLPLNDYKALNLIDTTPEKVNKKCKMVFHYSEKTKKFLIENGCTYDIATKNGKVKKVPFENMEFNSNIDICTITNIDLDANEIELKSDNYGGIYYVYFDNFQPKNKNGNVIKNRQCVTDIGIPFKLYIPKAATV